MRSRRNMEPRHPRQHRPPPQWRRPILPMAGSRSRRWLRQRNFLRSPPRPNNRALSVVLARSTDGGQTFTNYAWATPPFDPEGNPIGDYSRIAALNEKVYAVWTGRAPSQQAKPQTKSANKSTSRRKRREPTSAANAGNAPTTTNAPNSANAANPQNAEQTEEYSGLKMADT